MKHETSRVIIYTVIGIVMGACLYCTFTEQHPKEVYAHCPNCGWEGYFNQTIPETGWDSGYNCPRCMQEVEQKEGVPNG